MNVLNGKDIFIYETNVLRMKPGTIDNDVGTSDIQTEFYFCYCCNLYLNQCRKPDAVGFMNVNSIVEDRVYMLIKN